MYAFSNPVLVYQSGGIPILRLVTLDSPPGQRTDALEYVVPQNRVFHLLHLYFRYILVATSGVHRVGFDLLSPDGTQITRLLFRYSLYNETPPGPSVSYAANIIIPSGYKIVGYAINSTNTAIYTELSLFGIEYEIFRS